MPKPRKKPLALAGPDLERRATVMVRQKFSPGKDWTPDPRCTCYLCVAYRVVLKRLKGR